MNSASELIQAIEAELQAVEAPQLPPPRPQPVRSYQLEALLRRRESVPASARAVLDARIEALQCGLSVAAASSASEASAHVEDGGLSALSALVVELNARHNAPTAAHTAVHAQPNVQAQNVAAQAASQPSLLQETRAVWQKVRTQSHLRRARGKPLEHAGPLNSTKLVGRTLEVIGEISPGYQQQFVAYLDVLAELDALIGIAPSEPVAPTKRPSKPRAPRKRKAPASEE